MQLDYRTKHVEITAVYQTEKGVYYLRESGNGTDLVFLDKEQKAEILHNVPWTFVEADFRLSGDTVEIYLAHFFEIDVTVPGYIFIEHTSDTTFVDESNVWEKEHNEYLLIKKLPNKEILVNSYDYFHLLSESGDHLEMIIGPFERCQSCTDFEDEYFFDPGMDARLFKFDSTFQQVLTAESNIQDLIRLKTGNYALVLSDKIQIYDGVLSLLLEEMVFPDNFEFMQDIAFLGDQYYIGISEGDVSSIYSYNQQEGWDKVYSYPCPNMRNRFILPYGDELFLVGHQHFDGPVALSQTLRPLEQPTYYTVDIAVGEAALSLTNRRDFYDGDSNVYHQYEYDLTFNVTNDGIDTIEDFSMFSEGYSGFYFENHFTHRDFEALAPGETRLIECSHSSSPYPLTAGLEIYIPGANGTIDENCMDNTTTIDIITSTENLHYNEQQIQVYPNPAWQRLFVENPYSSRTEVVLSDLQGKVHFRQEMYDFGTFDVTDLAPGVYFVQFEYEHGLQVQKVIIGR